MKKTFSILSFFAIVMVAVFGFRLYWAWGQLGDLSGYELDETASTEIKQLNSDISGKKDAIDELKRKQDAYKMAIKEKQAEKADLENQLAIFDNRLAAIEANVMDVKLNIDKTLLEIRRTDLEIMFKTQEINKEKERIALALGLLYKEGNKSELEVLLTNDSLTDYLNQLEYLKDINSGIKDSLVRLKIVKERLDQDRKDLDLKKLSLIQLENDLLTRQNELIAEREGRTMILEQTKASETEYQRLLEQARKEQELASADISYMEKAIRDRLSKSKKLDALNAGAGALIWPVTKNTITAYFHDPDYPFKHLFEHPAIDIRAAQGTSIRAAAAGYVGRVKYDGSNKYAYVMIVHGDGLATVYGHVSKVYVTEDQYVEAGTVIALSGGLPGTPGSGPLTTGSHLHFEVRSNGIPVNPLDYLAN